MYQKLSKGISQAIVCDGQITIYHLTDMRRDTVDAWIKAINIQIQDCVDNDKHLITLNHFDGEDIGPTPYSNIRGKEITNLSPNLEGYTAFVMHKNHKTIEMQVTMRRDMAPTRQRFVFFDFDEALNWLKDKVKTPCTETTSS